MNKRTKALAIPKEVKERVCERDGGRCILCGKAAPTGNPLAYSCAHYISRSQSGLGIEENILTLCPECHRLYDQSGQRSYLRPFFADYLRCCYPNWDETRLTYDKYGG